MSKKVTRQIELQVSGLHVREAEGEERSRTIEGHAVVFGVRSVNLTPWSSYREVYEVMERGCITTELLNRSDVVLTAFHDNTAILGRWRQGKGTLSLSLDTRGLLIRCTLADTARADELLSAIEKGVFTRIGSTKEQRIDVRLICATNSPLHERVAEGTFRQDLLYRINTIELHIPPLRERGNDVLLLADYFVDLYKRKYRKEVDGLNAEAREKLMRYTWPGNVRELQHAVERAVILSDRRTLGAQLFALRPTPAARKVQTATLNLEQLERTAIAEAVRVAEGNVNQAAELLGITRYALYRKMEKYGI